MNINRFLLISIILLFNTSFVLAYPIIPNSAQTNTSSLEYEEFNITGLNYTTLSLDTSDNFKLIRLKYTIYQLPQDFSIQLNNSKGDKVIAQITHYRIKGVVLDDIKREVIIYINGKKQTMYNTGSHNNGITTFITSKWVFGGVQEINNVFVLAFNPDTINIPTDESFTSSDKIIYNNYSYFLDTLIFPNVDKTTNKMIFYGIYAKYIDNAITLDAFDINHEYNRLVFPLKAIFLIGKGIIKVLDIVSIISDSDYRELQKWYLTPLSILNEIILGVLFLITFIWVNGILWFFAISYMILFIYAYITTGDILKTITKFIELTINFTTIVFIRPVIWIYDNLLIKIIGLMK